MLSERKTHTPLKQPQVNWTLNTVCVIFHGVEDDSQERREFSLDTILYQCWMVIWRQKRTRLPVGRVFYRPFNTSQTLQSTLQ